MHKNRLGCVLRKEGGFRENAETRNGKRFFLEQAGTRVY
jgi:hypothetical protein